MDGKEFAVCEDRNLAGKPRRMAVRNCTACYSRTPLYASFSFHVQFSACSSFFSNFLIVSSRSLFLATLDKATVRWNQNSLFWQTAASQAGDKAVQPVQDEQRWRSFRSSSYQQYCPVQALLPGSGRRRQWSAMPWSSASARARASPTSCCNRHRLGRHIHTSDNGR